MGVSVGLSSLSPLVKTSLIQLSADESSAGH